MANDPVPGTDAALLTDIKTQLAAGINATIDETTLAKTTQLPSSLGQKAAAQSVSIVPASDAPMVVALFGLR